MDGLNKFIYEIGSDSAFAILSRSNELLKQGKDVINLGIGQPDFPTSDHIVESAIKALRWSSWLFLIKWYFRTEGSSCRRFF